MMFRGFIISGTTELTTLYKYACIYQKKWGYQSIILYQKTLDIDMTLFQEFRCISYSDQNDLENIIKVKKIQYVYHNNSTAITDICTNISVLEDTIKDLVKDDGNIINVYMRPNNVKGEKLFILKEGIESNPRTQLCTNIEQADFVFLDFRDINNNPVIEYPDKTVIVDFRDHSNQVYNQNALAYFKRSVVSDEKFVKYSRKIHPISYCIKNACLDFGKETNRNTDISIFFARPFHRSEIFKSRMRVTDYIRDNFTEFNIHTGLCGSPGEDGRSYIQHEYYKKMCDSKIVVTCNPEYWEGDYRLFEALSSGTLVLVDKMITPVKNPFVDGEHLIYYDRNDTSDLHQKITYYLENNEIRETIAKNGYDFVRKYHKSSNKIDEILEEVEKLT